MKAKKPTEPVRLAVRSSAAAANEDYLPDAVAHPRSLPVAKHADGWDPFQVWLTRIKAEQDIRKSTSGL
ncbi:MAG: hypothetical protein R3E77_15790 [Steroidobacteraceae bacterium]